MRHSLLAATVVLMGTSGWALSHGIDSAARPTILAVEAPEDRQLAAPVRPPIEPLDVGTLGIELQIDRSRAPLSDVVEMFRTRTEANPADHISRTTLAALLMEQARATADLDMYAEAEAMIDDAIELAPGSVDARLVKAGAASARHDFSAALTRAQAVLADDPGNAAALAAVGDAQLELGRYAAARNTYDALSVADRSATTVSRLARLAFLTGDVAGSIELSTEALERASVLALRPAEGAFYWFQLGFFLNEAGDVEGAGQALDRALELDPAHPGSSELLARVRTSQGRLDDAIAIYRSLLIGGGAADLRGELATLLDLTGAAAGADEEIRAGLDLAGVTIGKYPAERRHLAGFLVAHDPVTALELAEADIATRQDVYAHDMLAWALLANGRAEEAHDAIQDALAVGTRDADLFFHGGVIAHAVGDEDQARSLLEAALAINPAFDPVDAPAAETLLADLG